MGSILSHSVRLMFNSEAGDLTDAASTLANYGIVLWILPCTLLRLLSCRILIPVHRHAVALLFENVGLQFSFSKIHSVCAHVDVIQRRVSARSAKLFHQPSDEAPVGLGWIKTPSNDLDAVIIPIESRHLLVFRWDIHKHLPRWLLPMNVDASVRARTDSRNSRVHTKKIPQPVTLRSYEPGGAFKRVC